MQTRTIQTDLFEPSRALPEGLTYVLDFLTPAEETALLAAVAELPLQAARYKSFTAKRRVVSYGSQYDFDGNELAPAPTLPSSLQPLRAKVGHWLAMPPEELGHALVAEYQPGTPLGWHRDAPNFAFVVGVSLGASCRMRFRPYPPTKNDKAAGFTLHLEPRSIYVLNGAARWRWQHSIPPTKALRYSVTFRSLAARAAPSSAED